MPSGLFIPTSHVLLLFEKSLKYLVLIFPDVICPEGGHRAA